MSTTLASMSFACLWGLGVGLVYFGGLWLTVRRLPESPRPNRLWTISYLLRLGLLCLSMWPLLQQARHTPLAPFAGIGCLLLLRMLMLRFLGGRSLRRRADA